MNILWKANTEKCPNFLEEVLQELNFEPTSENKVYIVPSQEALPSQGSKFFIWKEDLDLETYNQFQEHQGFLGYLSPSLKKKDILNILKNIQMRFVRNMKQAEVFQRVKSQNLKYENLTFKLKGQIEEQTKKLKSSQNELEVKVKFLRQALQIVKSFVEISSLESFFVNFKENFGEEGIKEVFLFTYDAGFYKLKSSAMNLNRHFSLNEIKTFDKKTWADIISRPVVNFKTYELGENKKYILGFEFMTNQAERSQSFNEKFNFLKDVFTMIIDALIDEEEIKKDSVLWADSFKSFKEPIFIIDEFYKIVRSNFGPNYNRQSCYKVLFDRDKPCERCPIKAFHQGEKKKVDGPIELNSKYDLNSFSFELSTEIQQRLWIHHYEDKESVEQLKGQFIKSEKFAYLGNLVDTVIHRISNPLTGMKMSTEVLMQDEKIHPFKEDLEEIYSALNRCFAIIKNLKGFSESKIQVETVQLKDLVASTLLLMKSVTRNIKFKIDIPEDFYVRCSVGLTQQVLFNLIHNSCQAMNFKGQIHIFCFEKEDFVYLDVVDAGNGIGKSLKAKVFDPFFSTKSKESGTGIGLFLSKMIMKQSGGDLHLISDQDLEHESPVDINLSGAHFSIVFPKKLV